MNCNEKWEKEVFCTFLLLWLLVFIAEMDGKVVSLSKSVWGLRHRMTCGGDVAIELEKSKVDLKVLLELVRENIILKHQKEININIQSDRNYSIQADEFHFYNVIYNIMDNAVKYATEKPQINIQSKENSKGLILKFTDNGCGIPENDLPFVFDKFYRVAREDSKDIEGFGIGLSYVKRVCEWHKWKVEAKNNDEKGITITIQINKNDYE